MRYRDLTGAFRIVAGMFVGIVLYANLGPQPEPEYREVRVSVPQIVKGEPDTIIKWRERIVYRTVSRETVAVADSGAVPTVQAFCRPSVLLAIGDTVKPASNPALIRSGTYDGRVLSLWEARSNGDLAKETFRVRAPLRFSMGDSAIVQGSRLWWVRPAAEKALVAAIFYGLGKL